MFVHSTSYGSRAHCKHRTSILQVALATPNVCPGTTNNDVELNRGLPADYSDEAYDCFDLRKTYSTPSLGIPSCSSQTISQYDVIMKCQFSVSAPWGTEEEDTGAGSRFMLTRDAVGAG
ncbi:hypothetical protein DPEC_G00298310 [Dallia pectoralis]|uniref:Uncharacterized protein n=1 Tax=Dallia pectoralis TaxID=75939 RepID=A0ACC2FFZ9_DALPE|nr:hypothetical protein DPEC_G00298310 [Dallia pectoralis]